MSETPPIQEPTSITLTEFRDHAWDYFALHAEQRLKTFHFFVVLETGLVGALLITARLSTGTLPTAMVSSIGLLIALLAFVFWKLDQRVKGMIKTSELALAAYERRAVATLRDEDLCSGAPFLNDPQVKGKVGLSPFGLLSYSKCFGIVFAVFGLLGLGTCLLYMPLLRLQ